MSSSTADPPDAEIRELRRERDRLSAENARLERLVGLIGREPCPTKRPVHLFGVDLASYDRFFPTQDFLPAQGSIGNLIALPLQGKCRKWGTTGR
jgi:hypothetical protein